MSIVHEEKMQNIHLFSVIMFLMLQLFTSFSWQAGLFVRKALPRVKRRDDFSCPLLQLLISVFCSETTLRVLQGPTLVEPCPSINLSFLMTEKRCSSQKRAYNRISIRPVYTMNARAKWRTVCRCVASERQITSSWTPAAS